MQQPLELIYQVVKHGNDIVHYKADIYQPEQIPYRGTPVLVYFHSGGLTAGSRGQNPWFPKWIIRDALENGFTFVSVDYTLLKPGTAFDMIRDVKRCFQWVSSELKYELAARGFGKIDSQAVAVAGESAGGYLTYLAAVHAEPKPKAVASLYGMGGDFLSDHHVKVKKNRFSYWISYLSDATPFAPLDSSSSRDPVTLETTVDDANPRVPYFTWLVQEAKFLEALTGDPDISQRLAQLPAHKRAEAIPIELVSLFPQVLVDRTFPPSFLLHGNADTAVLIEETDNIAAQLKWNGVPHEYVKLDFVEHGFDWGEVCDEPALKKVVPFLYEQVTA